FPFVMFFLSILFLSSFSVSPCFLLHLFLISLLVFFFFYCSGDHRDLHSFPTRRSSDLAIWRVDDAQIDWFVQRDGNYVPLVPSRSEEHTSELQSRRDLVCRLLLEKKKSSSSMSSRFAPA